MQMVTNKTIAMLGGGVAGFAGAEKFADDVALSLMYYSGMGAPPPDVQEAVWSSLSSVIYVIVIAGAMVASRLITKNAPDLLEQLRGTTTTEGKKDASNPV